MREIKEEMKERGSKKETIENKKINLTDNDANYMKERAGCIKPNYNSQIAVEEEHQLILANDVVTEANDLNQFSPMVDKIVSNTKSHPQELKADAGYHSEKNIVLAEELESDVLINDPNKNKVGSEEDKYDKVNFIYDEERDVYICPEGKELVRKATSKGGRTIYTGNECSSCANKKRCTKKSENRTVTRKSNEKLIEQNREKLLSSEGKASYKKRMHTVEPVFGNIKHNLGYRSFLLRGLKNVQGEFTLMCIAHNIKKMFTWITNKKIPDNQLSHAF